MILPLLALANSNAYAAYEAEQQEIKAGNASIVYQVMLAQLDEEAGNPEFDYVFGLAALNSLRYEQAVFAFERVLLMEPKHYRASLELARVYHAMENYDAALKQFDRVLSIQPPENVVSWIEKFKLDIEKRRQRQSLQVILLANAGLGVDSNINSAPPIGISTLDSTGIDDKYWEFGAGLSLSQPISKTKAWFGSANFSHQDNLSTNEYDNTSLSLSAGIDFKTSYANIRLPLQFQWLNKDRENYRNFFGVGPQISKAISKQDQVAAVIQYGIARHPDEQTRDLDTFTITSSWLHVWNRKFSIISKLGWSADYSDIVNNEKATALVGTNLKYKYFNHSINFDIGYQKIDYSANLTNPHPSKGSSITGNPNDTVLFTAARDEHLVTSEIRWTFNFSKSLSSALFFKYYKNYSNHENLFQFEREVYGLSLSATY